MGKNRGEEDSLPHHRSFFSESNAKNCFGNRTFNAPVITRGTFKNKTRSRENLYHSYKASISQKHPNRTPKTSYQKS
jgi:hypothetical protein